MGLDLGTLFLKVDIRGSANLTKLERQLGRTESTAKSLTRALGGISVALVALKGAKEAVEMADSFTEVSNRIKLATESSKEFRRAQSNVIEVARSTGSEIESTALLFQRMENSTRSLSLSQGDLSGIVTTVAKAVALGGSNAAEASGAMRQFTQALSANFQTSSQELNSILEQTPGLAKAIADGLGVPVDALKGMAKQGELTRESVVKALQSTASNVEQAFDGIAFSVGKSFQKIETGATSTIGRLDELFGGSAAFSELAEDLSKVLASEELSDDIFIVTQQWLTGMEQMGAGYIGLAEIINQTDLLENLELDLSSVPADIVTSFKIAWVEASSFLERMNIKAKQLKQDFFPAEEPGGFRPGRLIRDENGKVTDNVPTELTRDQKLQLKFEEDLKKSNLARFEALTKILEANQKVRDDAKQDLAERKALLNDQIDAGEPPPLPSSAGFGSLYAEALRKQAENDKEALEELEKFNTGNIKKFEDALQSTLSEGLLNAFEDDFDSIEDLFKDMLKKMAAEALAANIVSGLGFLTKGIAGGGGGVLGTIGGVLGFANGGRPPVGVPSIVGEEGAEVFVPDQAGTIVPNGALGGQTITNNITIVADNPNTFRSSSGKIASTLSAAMRR